MDLAANLMLGFEVALSPINLVYCLVGVLVGTLIGVLPGIGPIATISMLLPRSRTTNRLIVSAPVLIASLWPPASTLVAPPSCCSTRKLVRLELRLILT